MTLYRRAMSDDRRGLLEYVGDRSTVLVLAPHLSAADNEACIDLLTGRKPRDANVLSVTVSETPDERLDLWRREVGERLPKRATLVDAGSQGTVDSQVAASEEFPTVSVDALPADAGLVDVGISVARYLSAWESNSESTFLCLHSLTTLLDSFERERVLSFVQSLNALCDCMGVRSHHHMDPGSHSQETVEAFHPQYEMVVEHLPDHGWLVSDDESAESPFMRGSTSSTGVREERLPNRSEMTPLPFSLDSVLSILSVGRRRTILYHLRDRDADGPISLNQLVERVQRRENAAPNRESSLSAAEVRIALAHNHLPKLDEAGIVEYDADEHLVTYNENPALESCLDYVEILEFG